MMKMLNHGNMTIGTVLGLPCGKGAFMIGAAFCMVLASAWSVLLLMPYGWHQQDSIMWSFDVSLLTFGVTGNAEAMKAQRDQHQVTRLSQLFDTMERRDPIWIAVARYEFCQEGISEEWCDYFHRLHIASVLLLLLGSLTVCCYLMGAMVGFFFHYIKPRKDLHRWAAAYLSVAPVAGHIGLIQYYFLTKDFGALIGEANATFGWMFLIAMAVSCISWIPCWIMTSFAFRFSWDEDSKDSASTSTDEEKLWGGAEPEASGDYGAMLESIRTGITSGAAPFFSGAVGIGDSQNAQKQEGHSSWSPTGPQPESDTDGQLPSAPSAQSENGSDGQLQSASLHALHAAPDSDVDSF